MLHNCDHQCINTEGSFDCQCNEGYQLQSDGHTCQGWDERFVELVRSLLTASFVFVQISTSV